MSPSSVAALSRPTRSSSHSSQAVRSPCLLPKWWITNPAETPAASATIRMVV